MGYIASMMEGGGVGGGGRHKPGEPRRWRVERARDGRERRRRGRADAMGAGETGSLRKK